MSKNDLVIEDTAAELYARELRENSVTLHVGQVDASALLNEMAGRMQQAEFMETSSRLSILYSLQRIKESKSYKGAYVRNRKTGEYMTVKTWDDYCEAFEKSREQIDEDLRNLAVFGDNLIKIQDSLGIGYRELRKIRAGLTELPKEEQDAALIELAAMEDKEEAMARVDELQGKLIKAEKSMKEAESKRDVAERMAEKLAKSRDEADRALEEHLRLQLTEPQQTKIAKDSHARKDLSAQADIAIVQTAKFCGLCATMMVEGDYDLREHVNEQVRLVCETFANALADSYVDVNFRTVMAARYESDAEPDTHNQ